MGMGQVIDTTEFVRQIEKAIANGIATLDSNAKVPKAQIDLIASDVGAIATETDPTVATFTKGLTSNNTILSALNAATGSINAARLPAAYLPLSGGGLTGALTSNSLISTSNATASTSPTTGASVIAGGQGIGGNQWVGGTINGLRIGLGGGGIAQNTAVGVNALPANTTGTNSSAFGFNALSSNTTGINLSAFGVNALFSNSTGSNLSAFGFGTLFSNTTGINSSAFGVNALFSNSTGSNLSAFGRDAGRYIADGTTALTVSNNSCFFGVGTKGTQGATNENVFGYNATGNGSNTVTIGDINIVATHLRGVVNIPNTTPSTSSTTGACIIAGGQGIGGNQHIGGFTSFGGTASGHPLKKEKLIEGFTPSIQGGTNAVLHGLNSLKIIGVSFIVDWTGAGGIIPSGYDLEGLYDVLWGMDASNFYVMTKAGASANVLNKNFRALISYTA